MFVRKVGSTEAVEVTRGASFTCPGTGGADAISTSKQVMKKAHSLARIMFRFPLVNNDNRPEHCFKDGLLYDGSRPFGPFDRPHSQKPRAAPHHSESPTWSIEFAAYSRG